MHRRSLMPLTLALTMLGSVISPFHPIQEAHADDTAKARTLFQEGLQLETGGNYAGALAKFQEVAQLKRTPAVLFHVAFCQEKLGKLVAALGGYRLVVIEGGEDPKNAKVVQTAQEALAGLEKRIPSITVKRGKGADLAKITLDGVELGGSTLDKPQQVDPGAHALAATLAGKLPYKETVQITEGENKTVEVTLKEDPKSKQPAEKDPTEAEPPATGTATEIKPPPPSSSVVPYVVLGVGAASLVTSGVFYYMRSSAINDLDGKCRGNICPESARSVSESGKTSTLIGNITLGLGVVGIGVGAVLLLTSKSTEKATQARGRSLDVVLHPNYNGGSASLVGTF